jgi:hypothetical protein
MTSLSLMTQNGNGRSVYCDAQGLYAVVVVSPTELRDVA